MLGQLEGNGKVVISDLEAGVGTLQRMKDEHVDTVLVVVESSTKSIEAARRAAEIGSKVARVIVVANRIGDDEEFEEIRLALGDHEYVRVPDDPAIRRADKDGVAPIDAALDSPGVKAIGDLAKKLSGG
ncbi:MAG: hypothetical protein H0U53_10775 [Actinobacteria bacterium]|nr:hypothetical protein [Actinomycetota bacterium]